MLTLLMFHTSIKWTFTQLQKKSTYQINAIKNYPNFFPSNNNSNHRFYRYFKCLLGFFTKLSMVHYLCADVRDLRVPIYFLCFSESINSSDHFFALESVIRDRTCRNTFGFQNVFDYLKKNFNIKPKKNDQIIYDIY